MKKAYHNISGKTQINFYLNLVNFVPFLILIFSGLLIEFNYHMHALPDDFFVLGMNKFSWLLIHKISAVVSLAGIIVHCKLHWKYIKSVTRNFRSGKSGTKIFLSYYLLILGIFTMIPALHSWVFLDYKNQLRFHLVEIHDKLALVFVILAASHLVSRAGWMLRAFRKKIVWQNLSE